MTGPDRHEAQLAAWASHSAHSLGRRHEEARAPSRTAFQRDRDRIVHCTAFRRLEYKTQVFLNHEGDLFRTRLTHSIEVAQIARSIARALRLNEDLTEAIALAHDLGHTPFGHSGQDALNECMAVHGGFEHNLQSLRVVDELEQRYAAFDGLNLCFETREGILKHCAPVHARALGALGARFLDGGQPSLEAQVANLADEIAYGNHDVDDGLRSGLLTPDQLQAVPLFARHADAVRARYPGLERRRLVAETVRAMINEQVTDLLDETRRRIASAGLAADGPVPGTERALRRLPALVAFTPAMQAAIRELKAFLMRALYRHPQVVERMEHAQQVVRDLFAAYSNDAGRLPDDHRQRFDAMGPRAIADYIAGMTDRYALREHQRLRAGGAPSA
jgi:dGTPase